MEIFVGLIVVTAIWVLIDAKSIGVKKGLISGMGNMGPWAWFFGCLGLWILAFPLYLAKRGAFKRALSHSSQPAIGPSSIDQLERLAQLKDKGAITTEEFEAQKKQLLAGAAAAPQTQPQGGTPWFAITFFLVVGALIATWFIGWPEQQAKELDELAKAKPGSLRPDGELSEIFAVGGKYTDLQRENKLREIKGQVVAWRLPVYEVSRTGKEYRVQTETGVRIGPFGADLIGAFVFLTPRNDEERRIIEGLKTGDTLAFKGRIVDVTLRTLEIRPALLTTETAASPPAVASKETKPPASESVASATPSAKPASEPLTGMYWCNVTTSPDGEMGRLLAFFSDGVYTDNVIKVQDGKTYGVSLTFGRHSVSGDRLTLNDLGVTNQAPIQMETIQRLSNSFEQRIVQSDNKGLITRGVKSKVGSDVYNLPGDFALQCESKGAIDQPANEQRARIPVAALQ